MSSNIQETEQTPTNAKKPLTLEEKRELARKRLQMLRERNKNRPPKSTTHRPSVIPRMSAKYYHDSISIE